jgi:hypothetical protein
MNININGLSFIHTHDEDPVRFDVRDTNFKRVAYVEYDGKRVLCTTKGGKELYNVETNLNDPNMWLSHCAGAINDHLEKKREQKLSKAMVKMWLITGYKGCADYDGQSNDNICFEVLMDARFTKEDVEEIFFNRFSKKHRTVAIKATELSVHVICDPGLQNFK